METKETVFLFVMFLALVASLALFLWAFCKMLSFHTWMGAKKRERRKTQVLQELGMTPAEARDFFRAYMRAKFPNLSAYRVVMVEGVLRHLQPLHPPAVLLLEEDALQELEGRDEFQRLYCWSVGPQGLKDLLSLEKYWMKYHTFIRKHTTADQEDAYLGYHLDQLKEILDRPDVSSMLLSVDGGDRIPAYCGMTLEKYNFFHNSDSGARERQTTGACSTYKIAYTNAIFEFAKNNDSPDYTLIRITEK